MSKELVVLGQEQLALGGQGIDFNSRLFELKPATLNIVQPLSDVVSKGVSPGVLRISESGEVFKEMHVALLAMPSQQRDFYEGTTRTKDTRLCYSYDMVKPDARAPEQQSHDCSTCQHADWLPWREAKNKTGKSVQALIPKCEVSYYVRLIDTEYKLPLQMWIRGASKGPFEAGMKEVARKLYQLKSQGLNPNIYDVKFTLSAEKGKGDNKNFVLKLSEFSGITEVDRAAFGETYLRLTNRPTQTAQVAPESQTSAEVDAEIVTGTATGPVDGEYVSF